MNRRTAIRRLATFFLTTVSLAEAQQPKKVHRIGYLASSDPARESTRAEAIRLALRALGYIEGQNIAIEYRYTERKIDRLPALAAELIGSRWRMIDRKSTRLNSSHIQKSRMPSSA